MKDRVIERGRQGESRKELGEGLPLAVSREEKGRCWQREYRHTKRDGVEITGPLVWQWAEDCAHQNQSKREHLVVFCPQIDPLHSSLRGALRPLRSNTAHTCFYGSGEQKKRVQKWSQEGLKSSSFMSVYLCWEQGENRRARPWWLLWFPWQRLD